VRNHVVLQRKVDENLRVRNAAESEFQTFVKTCTVEILGFAKQEQKGMARFECIAKSSKNFKADDGR